MDTDIDNILDECSKKAFKPQMMISDMDNFIPYNFKGKYRSSPDSRSQIEFADTLSQEAESHIMYPVWQINENRSEQLQIENEQLKLKLSVYKRMLISYHPARIALGIFSLILFLMGTLFLITLITDTNFNGQGLIETAIIIDSLFLLMSYLLLRMGVKKF